MDRPPLERTRRVARLYEEARRVARELGHELAEGGTGGGSDGNFTAALGVPTLDGLGAVGDGAHALHEHVEIGRWGSRCLVARSDHADSLYSILALIQTGDEGGANPPASRSRTCS